MSKVRRGLRRVQPDSLQATQGHRGSLATFRNHRGGEEVLSFNSPLDSFASAEFEADGDDEVVIKRALVMVEGKHTDSAKRVHDFPADRIQRIVENTNAWMARGGRVPWQQDHQKTQNANIGDLEGDLELRIITRDDLPDPRFRNLIGKLGAFTSRLIGKGKDVVRQVQAGRIKTLSPGIDVHTDIIREISATPTPAIVGLSTFRRGDAQFGGSGMCGLTFEDVEASQQDMDELHVQFDEMCDTFWTLIKNINDATEEALQGASPDDYKLQAIDDFSVRIQEMIGLSEQPPEQTAGDPPAPGQYSAFTIGGVEHDLATFRKKKKSLRDRALGTTTVGRVARGVGAATLLGGVGVALSKRGKGVATVSPSVSAPRPGTTSAGKSSSASGKSLSRTPGRREAGYRGENVGMKEDFSSKARKQQRRKSKIADSLRREENAIRGQSRGMALPSKRGTSGPNSTRRRKRYAR